MRLNRVFPPTGISNGEIFHLEDEMLVLNFHLSVVYVSCCVIMTWYTSNEKFELFKTCIMIN